MYFQILLLAFLLGSASMPYHWISVSGRRVQRPGRLAFLDAVEGKVGVEWFMVIGDDLDGL